MSWQAVPMASVVLKLIVEGSSVYFLFYCIPVKYVQ